MKFNSFFIIMISISLCLLSCAGRKSCVSIDESNQIYKEALSKLSEIDTGFHYDNNLYLFDSISTDIPYSNHMVYESIKDTRDSANVMKTIHLIEKNKVCSNMKNLNKLASSSQVFIPEMVVRPGTVVYKDYRDLLPKTFWENLNAQVNSTDYSNLVVIGKIYKCKNFCVFNMEIHNSSGGYGMRFAFYYNDNLKKWDLKYNSKTYSVCLDI